jgi:SAM-dependent methyltransferase
VSPSDVWIRRQRLSLPEATISARSRLLIDQYFSQLPNAVIGKRYDESLFYPAPGWWRYSLGPYLTAIATLDLNPGTILDVGCGDGLVTNGIAYLYPDVEVMALDVCALCLVTTRTIAGRLGLTNLRIVQGDAVNLQSLFPNHTFDLVLARAFSAFRNRCSCGRSLGEPIDGMNRIAQTTQIVQAIRQVLMPMGGRFVSTENWPGAPELWLWASTMASLGLRIDWRVSQGVRTARRRWSMLVSEVAPAPTGVAMADVLGLLVGAEMQDVGRGPPVTGYTAEALFSILRTDSFIFGFQATRNDAILRRELHSAGAILVSYDFTNGTERELRFWPQRLAVHLTSQLEQEASGLRTQGWDVLRFVPRADQPGDRQDSDDL